MAPICLEDRAPYIVSPRTPDCEMLFKHQTRMRCQDRIPAVVHLDESARLQTIPGTLSVKSPSYSSNVTSSGTFGCSATECQLPRTRRFPGCCCSPLMETQ
ncbi:carbamoyltransferase C-terminal domain-containing protein [Rhizobium anhuiense]|uniref:carbamoyltransferase C-terminal domain-containing protein n=1 Tax=Rhizobium TaxID=379 RepID=UPI003CC9F536